MGNDSFSLSMVIGFGFALLSLHCLHLDAVETQKNQKRLPLVFCITIIAKRLIRYFFL
jgi:hypothetical protein